jgi:hypothetical protein
MGCQRLLIRFASRRKAEVFQQNLSYKTRMAAAISLLKLASTSLIAATDASADLSAARWLK